MNQLLFPVVGAMLVFFVAVPCLTVAARALLAARPAASGGALTRTSSWRFSAIVGPTLGPTVWLVSAAIHQSETGTPLAACVIDHLGDDACRDVVLFGVLLAFLVTALQQSKAVLSTVGTVFGYVWVVLVIASGMLASTGLETVATLFEARPKQATALWLSIEAMQNGLGGGVEIVGGLWVFLISLQAIRQRRPCPLVHGLGLLVGTLGILTVLPPLGYLAAAFGIGQIAWFVLIGLYLCKQASTLHKNSTQKPEGILVTR